MENKLERYQKAMNIVDVMESSQLAKMMEKGMQIHHLNETLNQIFPKEFKGFFRSGRVENGVLSVEVKSAVVRQGILFRQSELLALIQQTYPEIRQFDVRINPDL